MRKLILAAVCLALLLAVPAVAANDGRPPPGTTIGRIIVPKLHINMKWLEGEPPANEDGFYPTHYRTTNWPGEGETVGISAHHYTHPLRPGGGGPFRHIDLLRQGDIIILTKLSRFGGGDYRYRVTGQRTIYCGWDKWNCPAIGKGFTNLMQPKLILTTCIGDGSWRRLLYAYLVTR